MGRRPATIRHRTSLFEDAARIVEAEFSSPLSLEEVARRVASSRRQLQRAYSEVGRTTFREHLARVRMERAAALLATHPLTVRDVADRVGYRQPAQFAKAFRRHRGLSPLGLPPASPAHAGRVRGGLSSAAGAPPRRRVVGSSSGRARAPRTLSFGAPVA